MTQAPEITQADRELLAAEYEAFFWLTEAQEIRTQEHVDSGDECALRAIARLRVERDEAMCVADRWLYHAQAAKEDVLRLLRIDDESDYGQTTQKNVDLRDDIRSRYKPGADEFRAPALKNDRLTADLSAARALLVEAGECLEPIASFADFATDQHGWKGTVQKERICDWFGPTELRKAADLSRRIREMGNG